MVVVQCCLILQQITCWNTKAKRQHEETDRGNIGEAIPMFCEIKIQVRVYSFIQFIWKKKRDKTHLKKWIWLVALWLYREWTILAIMKWKSVTAWESIVYYLGKRDILHVLLLSCSSSSPFLLCVLYESKLIKPNWHFHWKEIKLELPEGLRLRREVDDLV